MSERVKRTCALLVASHLLLGGSESALSAPSKKMIVHGRLRAPDRRALKAATEFLDRFLASSRNITAVCHKKGVLVNYGSLAAAKFNLGKSGDSAALRSLLYDDAAIQRRFRSREVASFATVLRKAARVYMSDIDDQNLAEIRAQFGDHKYQILLECKRTCVVVRVGIESGSLHVEDPN